MTPKREELLKELDRIIDVGIVNARHDVSALRHIREELMETDLDAVLRILKPIWKSRLTVNEDDGVLDIVLNDFDQTVVLCFNEEGRLIG